jgi:hypothetical protein
MRPELLFDVASQVPNRFLLVKLLAKATRGFHKPGSRIQDTANQVLVRFSRSKPIADVHSAQVSSFPSRPIKPGRKIVYTSRRSSFPSEVRSSNAILEAIRALKV